MSLLKADVVRPVLLALLGITLFFYNPIANQAVSYNTAIFKDGGALYASLRALTSVMSIVRDADIQVSVPITSLTTSPGQALEPVINTLDRMTNLLFAVVISSGVLTYALPIVAALGGLILAAGAILRSIVLVLGDLRSSVLAQSSRGLIIVGLLAAVCLPSVYAVAFVVGDYYTAQAWAEARAIFEEQEAAIAELDVGGIATPEMGASTGPAATEEIAPSSGNALDWARDTLGGAMESSADAIRGTIEATTGLASAMREKVAASTSVVTNGIGMAGSLFDASISIAVAYLVKLFVLPLLLLAGILIFIRQMRHDLAVPVRQFSDEHIPLRDARSASAEISPDNA
ncbi:hypothetical protein ACFSX5_15910 [Devosia albogilva]|uniref:Uncharacterized protein n=1 Tax=Devosia albogilva TaxID=429726 RepID=A0ABW5QNT9_9HYPH